MIFVYLEILAVLLWKRADRTEKSPGYYISVIKAAAHMYAGFLQKPCLPEDCTQRRYLGIYTWKLSGVVCRAQKEKVIHKALVGNLKDGVSETGVHLPWSFSFPVWA